MWISKYTDNSINKIKNTLKTMHNFFKILSDETRLRCLALIYDNKELCVCELTHALNLPQSKISRHLSLIKLNTLIIDKRVGQWVFYSIHPEVLAFKNNIMQITITDLKNTSPFKEDRERLLAMENRPQINNK